MNTDLIGLVLLIHFLSFFAVLVAPMRVGKDRISQGAVLMDFWQNIVAQFSAKVGLWLLAILLVGTFILAPVMLIVEIVPFLWGILRELFRKE